MQKREKRARKFTIRFTEAEYNNLESRFRKSTSSQLSQYLRSLAMGKPVVIKYRNESLDHFMEELIAMRQELNAIGNNLNQTVKKLHTLKQIPEFRQWIVGFENIHQQIGERTQHIESKISMISETWLQG